jgi:hypothetical protein
MINLSHAGATALRRERHRRALEGVSFSVMANDCWGGSLYQHLARPYNTPFVGLFMMGPCFVALAENLGTDLHSELTFVNRSRYPERAAAGSDYPLALLGDAEVHFLHYATQHQARTTWMRRLERLDPAKLRIKAEATKDRMDPTLVSRLLSCRPDALVLGGRGSGAPVTVQPYTTDGAELFGYSLSEFDIVKWLELGTVLPGPERHASALRSQ